ncbi:hypothetical protein A3G69_04390 [Candidatus Peribacteria bacterium RIFCSPLOWO2_12_FULL_53_10]|nr:MAG: hypothetical protein A3B61_03660 [Candidatus Peribacteria bacterium RIFCSPLOWO2_01_FULL_53_10]OGJ71442.1 MAG: hypothetical protein A3G69_04390 [Candidatus Peribacteria bacterium RIFCSPLOWO2_12_FULL_53_10]
MRRIFRSLGFALEGLTHAFAREKNLQLFLLGYAAVLIFAATQNLQSLEWLALVVSGSAFIAVELFNTALERLTNAVDSLPKEKGNLALHHNMKATKDVSAAAALVGFMTVVVTILLILGSKMITLP